MDTSLPEHATAPSSLKNDRADLSRFFTLETLKICLIYLFFGILWIVFSDRIFLSLATTPEEVVLISSVKGVLFIIVTTILLFLLIRNYTRRLGEKNEELHARNEALSLMQAEWESTYNAMSDWTALISPEGRVIRSNEASEALFKIPAREIEGKNVFELTGMSPEGSLLRRVLATKKREVNEYSFQDGNRWAHITIDPVPGPDGRIVSAVLIVRDITERMRTQKALEQAKKKLSLLNYVTFNDLRNLIFTLSGYQQYMKEPGTESTAQDMIRKQEIILEKITRSLKFAQSYQDLGLKPAQWQNVNHVFLMAISHIDFQHVQHRAFLDGLEVFADPLLEQVFQILADNTLTHGETATSVTFRYEEGPESLTLFFEDNGVGIPAVIKEKIFLPDFQVEKRVGLFLAREILEITGITIWETGEPGRGACFAMNVPKGVYRFSGGQDCPAPHTYDPTR